ncbi:MAG: hypothetical protein AAFW65_05415 [Pseudomonadota bacterium]
MTETANRPNTLRLAAIRRAGDPGAAFRPGILYVDHIVAVLEASDATTEIVMATGVSFEVNMTLEKFATRQRIDKSTS